LQNSIPELSQLPSRYGGVDETVLKSVCIIMLSALLPADSNMSIVKTVSTQAAALKTKVGSRSTPVELKSPEVEKQVASVEVFVSGFLGS
jgi:hypothetical protein